MAITFVNGGSSAKEGGLPFNYTLGWQSTAGNTLIVALLAELTTTSPAVSDGINSYTPLPQESSANNSITIWFCQVTTTTTLTIDFTGTNGSACIAYALEFSGIGVPQLNGSSFNTSSSSPLSAGGILTTVPASAVVALFSDQSGGSGSFTQNGSWLISSQENNFGSAAVYQIVSSATTYTPEIAESSVGTNPLGYGLSISGPVLIPTYALGHM